MPCLPASAGSPCSEPCTQLGTQALAAPLQAFPCTLKTWRVHSAAGHRCHACLHVQAAPCSTPC